MPIPLLAAAAIAGGISGAGKIGLGIGQSAHAKRMEERNIRPEYEIQDEYVTNRNLGYSMAQEGLTETSKDYYADQAARGLAAGTDAVLQGGGNANVVTALADQYTQSLRGLAAQDSQLQTENVRYAIDRNVDLASQKTMKWTLDKFDKYKEIAAAASAEKQAGLQNIFGGIDQISSTISAYSMGKNYEDQMGTGGQATGGPTAGRTTYVEPTDRSRGVPSSVPITVPDRRSITGSQPVSAIGIYNNSERSGTPMSMQELYDWYQRNQQIEKKF